MLMTRLSGKPKAPSVGMIRAKGLLRILGASQPLTIMELRLAYAFASPTSPDSSYSENLISEEGVIDACEDLITTNGYLIYLRHTSESFCFDLESNGTHKTMVSPTFTLSGKPVRE